MNNEVDREMNFSRNSSYIARRFPSLYKKIQSFHDPPNFEKAEHGGLTLKIEGIYLESRFDPERENNGFERYAGSFFVFLGAGLGYHINRLLEVGRAGVLIEKRFDVFRASLFIISPEVLERLRLLIGVDVETVSREIGAFLTRKTAIVPHRRSMQLDERYYDRITLAIKDRIHEMEASRLTDVYTRSRWAKNVLRNSTVQQRRIYGTKNLSSNFSGPAVLVASGPFLEEARTMLDTLARKLPVFSLLPSMAFLLHQGIRPDFVVSTDAGFYNRYRLFTALRSMQKSCPARGIGGDNDSPGTTSTPLIAALSADSCLIRLWPGDVYVFSHGLPMENQLKRTSVRLMTVPMQGTAAIVMILIARMMGFSPLYLAGYDFAVQGLKNHHRGAGFDDFLENRVTRYTTRETIALDRLRRSVPSSVKDSTGARVYTTRALMLYRNWLEGIDLGGTVRINRGLPVRGMDFIKNIPDLPEWNRSLPEKEPLRTRDIADDLEDLMRRISGDGGKILSPRKRVQEIYRLLYGETPPGLTDGLQVEIEHDVSRMVALLKRVRKRVVHPT